VAEAVAGRCGGRPIAGCLAPEFASGSCLDVYTHCGGVGESRVGQVAGESIYRDHAEAYARFSERRAPNARYDRPAILRLAGDVAGKRVLELGCAGGLLTAQLADRGADVLAVDREPQLVALARRRLGGHARIEVGDLERPLEFVPLSVRALIRTARPAAGNGQPSSGGHAPSPGRTAGS
jgi:Methyltransferase domain